MSVVPIAIGIAGVFGLLHAVRAIRDKLGAEEEEPPKKIYAERSVRMPVYRPNNAKIRAAAAPFVAVMKARQGKG